MFKNVRNFLMSSSALCVFATASFAQEAAPVKEVVLSTAGLAHYTRAVDLSGPDGVVTLRSKGEDMDDVLKSLIVYGNGLEGVSLSVGSAHALEDVLRSTPFDVSDLSRLDMILKKIPGVEVSISSRSNTGWSLQGRVLGVADGLSCENDVCPPVLSVLLDDGQMEQVLLMPDVSVQILDEVVSNDLARSMQALAENGLSNNRMVKLDVDRTDDSQGAVYISSVLTAPIWKPAYKAIVQDDNSIDLQAWAVVENASGEDWDDVRLVLSSGNPRTLQADLYARTYGHRERAKTAPPAPQAMMEMSFSRSMGSDMMDSNGMAQAEMMAQPLDRPSVSSQEGKMGGLFEFDEKVDVAAGEVVSVPFLSENFEARLVAHYLGQGQRSFSSPSRMMDIKNSLDVRLPRGVVTLYDVSEGYLGDTQVDELHAGERRFLDVGTETKIKVKTDTRRTERETRMSINRGVLRIDIDEMTRTTYTALGADAGSVPFVLDHPIRPGFKTTFEAPGFEVEDDVFNKSLDVKRFSSVIEEGESRVVEIVERRPVHRTYGLSNMSVDELLRFSARSLDKETKAFLEEVAEIRRELTRVERQLSVARERQDEIESDQMRYAQVLDSLDSGTSQHNEFSNLLLESQKALNAVRSEISGLQEDSELLSDELSELIAQ